MGVLIISSKGWVVIPANLRKKYKLAPGLQVRLVDYGGVLTLVPALSKPAEQAAGMARGMGSMTDALLAEHRAEAAR
jgi:bifunctional DNA-binding transcriptional regulator/antitoxin component of YhaV-PrlF toxin-antitoxin module